MQFNQLLNLVLAINGVAERNCYAELRQPISKALAGKTVERH
jgi:hypothetical protein